MHREWARFPARTHLINDFRQGTASAVPKSFTNSRVLTPEVQVPIDRGIYEIGWLC